MTVAEKQQNILNLRKFRVFTKLQSEKRFPLQKPSWEKINKK